MANVHDVAAYILKQHGTMTAMKLQKLVYYCQAWSLVWDERPLFPEKIRAWANGPVVYELYNVHRGKFDVTTWPVGDPDALDATAIETVDAILKFYGKESGQWLSDLTHKEAPWVNARTGYAPGEPSDEEITLASMAEYYGSL